MTIIPVIMCGGAGSRLWPASTARRPKPFLPLFGQDTLFTATVARMAPLLAPGNELLVVAGRAHQAAIAGELSGLGQPARLLLEPEARDSGPAMAAAAVQALGMDPEAVIAVVASDHHIPDAEAFREAVRVAADAALGGRIVTLGVQPTWPSSAFGYIAPDSPGEGVHPVSRFVEKPDEETARGYIDAGYLWNSGNFIARADVLVAEIERFEPDMIAAARAAVAAATPQRGAWLLSDAFRAAPKRSIDYAVMEKTDRASVLPVDFAWSDVGAWDAVIDAGGADQGDALRADAEGGLIRAGRGMRVAVLGVPDLIVVAEGGDVLVTTRGSAAGVRAAADAFPPAADRAIPLAERARALTEWMRLRVLPLWSTAGVSPEGWFHESLTAEGRPLTPFRRARVQPRQSYSLCIAGRLGWTGPWKRLAAEAVTVFEAAHGLPDGGYRTRLNPDGSEADGTALIYDLAFALMARAAMGETAAGPILAAVLDQRRHPAGGYVEADHRPYQSNALMHLFESFLAWETVEPEGDWSARADALARLALDRLIDAEGGFIREVYDADWNPAEGAEGRIVEPGHQFEWAYLIQTWAARRGDASGTGAARRLFDAGSQGVDPARGVAIDELDDQLRPARATARLWPQTERLKAALVLAQAADEADRPTWLAEASEALDGVRLYLSPDGVWGDVMDTRGQVADGPAPASTLYHLMTAVDVLASASDLIGAEAPIDLA